MLSLQLGNLYMLLALLGIFILNTTTEARVVHAYIWALSIADVGHVAATYAVMGRTAFVDIEQWNAMTWGNVGATVALFTCRSLYMLGVFGKDRSPAVKKLQRKNM